MDILYLLVPMSTLLVLALLVLFAWALRAGQFDDLEREGGRILGPDAAALDADQDRRGAGAEQSSDRPTPSENVR